MIIDAVNGPHHHHHRIKLYSALSANARTYGDLYYISSLRSASALRLRIIYCSQTWDVIIYLSMYMCESLVEYKWRTRERRYALLFLQFFVPFLFWGHSLSNSSNKKPKNEHFFTTPRKKRTSVKKFLQSELFSAVLHKKEAHTTKMNVLSTHAVALHGMNARGSQRTPSASTSSLIARKNTTRSHNTKKNINAARHHRQRSIIRYARQ